MNDYLAKAADLIATGAAHNEKYPGDSKYHEQAARYANGYATLAAIERGLVPAHVVETVLAALPDMAGGCR